MYDIGEWVYENMTNVGTYGNPPTDWTADCPVCGDTKGHLQISMTKQAVHCFRCDYSTSWVGLVRRVTGLPYPLAMAQLYVAPRAVHWRDKISKLSEVESPDNPAYDVKLPKGFVNLVYAKGSMAKRAKNYLIRRGFDEWYWARYNLGIADAVPGRVVIPVEYSYWQARSLFNWMEPKYLNPKSDSTDYIFNSVALTLYEEVVICEGAFSAMAVAENAIALIGKNMTKEKFLRLKNSDVKKYIVALDSDAIDRAVQIADKLYSIGKEVDIWRYNDGDPADNDGVVDKSSFDFAAQVKLLLNNRRK